MTARDSGEWHIRFRRSEEQQLQRRLAKAESDLAVAITQLEEIQAKLREAMERALHQASEIK